MAEHELQRLDALGTSYEVILINDGSRDRSAAMLADQFHVRPDTTRVVLGPREPDRFEWDERLLAENKPDYVTFSNFDNVHVERFANLGVQDPVLKLQVDRYKAFGSRLSAEYRIDRVFGVFGPQLAPDMMYVQPVIYVWKRRHTP